MTGTAGEAAARGAFVGRRAELDALSAAMEAARAATPQIVWLEGEAGIGKTAFTRRFLSSTRDVVVLDASGDESEATFDYGVVQQLLARATPSAGTAGIERHPAIASASGSFAVGAELLAMLGSIQDTAPVVLVLDDAHWIDSGSAGALLFALRRLHVDRVLVLIVSRPGGLAHLGQSWTRLLSDPDRVKRIELAGLSAAEVRELAERLGTGPLALAAGERLREHTGGHPLYVKALLSELPLDRLNFGDGELPAPHSFAATVLARLADVGTDVQNLVAAAAIAGPHCPLMLAGAVAGIADPLPALEEAIAADLLALVPARIPEEVTFPHPLIRAAVYDDLSPTRRRTLHLACAEKTSGAGALAHRVAASRGADDALAAELRDAAEAELAAGRLLAGVQRLLWASRIAGSQTVRERSLMRAVECLVLAGDIPAATSHLDALLSCSDSARRSFTLGMLSGAAGRMEEAAATFREVMARPDYASDPDLHGPATASLAIAVALQGRPEEALELAPQVLDSPNTPPTARTTATQALALGLLLSGRGEEAIAALDATASRIEPEPFEADLLISRGTMKIFWGELESAYEDHTAAIRWARAGIPFRGIPDAYAGLAEVEYRFGRWDDALTHVEIAISLVEDSDRAWELPLVHGVAAYVHAGRGNWTAAAGHVEVARRAAEETPLPMCLYYAGTAAATFAWVRGDWADVLRAVVSAQSGMGDRSVAGLGRRVVQAMAAEALLFSDQLEHAELVLDGLEREIGDRLADPTRVDLWRLRGSLEHVRKRPREARAAFDRGKEAARQTQAPLNEGLLELAFGQFLRRNGSRRAAIAALQSSDRLFAGLGAEPFLLRCRAELTACGVRSRDSNEENGFGLTAREEVVARLVASGKSNREVGEELYLSTKAIEYHLGNVFAKVGVRSRHELAGRLGGMGLAAGSD